MRLLYSTGSLVRGLAQAADSGGMGDLQALPLFCLLTVHMSASSHSNQACFLEVPCSPAARRQVSCCGHRAFRKPCNGSRMDACGMVAHGLLCGLIVVSVNATLLLFALGFALWSVDGHTL